MQRFTAPQDLQRRCLELRGHGSRIALVPTMGYFHAGHESLMQWARQNADTVVVSLFVNPAQFGPSEDLASYPRDLERDSDICREHGVDYLFTPTPEAMYLPGHDTWIKVEHLSAPLCGRSRPIHFRGVATIVAKLLMLALPDVAVFGQKDWQQLAVIRRMALDLNLPTAIEGRPTVREEDGLAMSSRNVYLTSEERAQAPQLYMGLEHGAALLASGERDMDALDRAVKAYYADHLNLGRLDYLEFLDPDALTPDPDPSRVLMAVAMHLGKARLIDNLVASATPPA